MNDWKQYYRATKNRAPRALLKKTLPFAKKKGKALDLGAGALNDSRFLVENGYEVVAVDMNQNIHTYARNIPSIRVHVSSFNNFPFPKETFNLVSAQYALPFNPPSSFDVVFGKLTKSLKRGGIFTGQFFGSRDSWSKNKNMTFHSEESIKNLLEQFTIIHLREKKKFGKTVLGKKKFWHVFDVIARRN